MSTSFSPLRHDGIQTDSLHRPAVFDGCDHGDYLYAVAMTCLDHLRSRIAQAHAEDRHMLLQNDLKALRDQIRQLGWALRLWREAQVSPERIQGGLYGLDDLVGEVSRLHGGTDFRREYEVYPKWLIRLAPNGTDGLTQLVGGQQKAGEEPEASRVGDSRREIRSRNATHAGLEDGIVNAQEITEPGMENGARC